MFSLLLSRLRIRAIVRTCVRVCARSRIESVCYGEAVTHPAGEGEGERDEEERGREKEREAGRKMRGKKVEKKWGEGPARRCILRRTLNDASQWRLR